MRDITFALLISLAFCLSILPQLFLHNFDYETLTIYCFGAMVGTAISFLMFFKLADDVEKNGRKNTTKRK